MLRVHFTAEDLWRVTFADEPAPLMELGLALAMLQRDDGSSPEMRRWRRQLGRICPGPPGRCWKSCRQRGPDRSFSIRPRPIWNTGSTGS